jgi:hypothetical protein
MHKPDSTASVADDHIGITDIASRSGPICSVRRM